MRLIQLIGLINIGVGAAAFSVPLKFSSTAAGLFASAVPPPFSMDAIRTLTYLLFIPGAILVLNGIALLFLGTKLRGVAELKVFSEAGEFMGRVKGVEVREGKAEKLELEGREEVLPREELSATGEVLIVKEERAEGKVRHEFMGKEVYTQLGEYLGKVESVALDDKGDVADFTVVRGENRRIINFSDVDATDGVIIVRPQTE
ncbi:MAG: PRC-barrel domain-containing protein [Candidatus Hydrothermarchaeota archaeon]|nr:PRC-barrel domain-containing protein [Candidatus Hydrothermarchaeota archaeon]